MPSCRCPRVLHLTICFVKEALRLIEVLDTLQPLWYCRYWNPGICHPADCFRSAVHLTVFTSGFHQGVLDRIVQLCLLPSAVTSLLFTRFCVSSAGFLLHLAVSVFYNENGLDRFFVSLLIFLVFCSSFFEFFCCYLLQQNLRPFSTLQI